MSVQILTDSTSDILPEEAEQKGVRVVPLLVNFGEEAFRENVEITHQEYFRRLAQAESLPTTSQPTPQDFLAHFEQVQDAGDSLVCVLLASKLSGTFQSAQLAKELSGYDEIYIVDSQQALCGLRMLVVVSYTHLCRGPQPQPLRPRWQDLFLAPVSILPPSSITAHIF